MFKYMATSGAHPWSINTYFGRDHGLCTNPFAHILMLNVSDCPLLEKAYLQFSERWKYTTWIVEWAKKNDKLEELLNNNQCVLKPLVCALTDEEDKDGQIAEYLLKNGAQFSPEMLIYLLEGSFYTENDKKVGLKNLCALLKYNELATFFDSSMNTYSGEKIWKLVQELEKSKRKDIAACLYALYMHITPKSYTYVREKIEAGESKKTIKLSLDVMKRLENSNTITDYIKLNKLNPRSCGFDTKALDKDTYRNLYNRYKYKIDTYATM